VIRNGMALNYWRIALAALGATVAYLMVGGVLFGLLPQMRNEFQRYPGVYRTQRDIKSVMPVGMAGMFFSILTLATIYALSYRGGSGVVEGARFGVLIGIFAVGAFVLHNFVNLQIGVRITLHQAVAYLFEWTIVGIVIGLIYKGAATP
jgi:hypothetical protein